MCIYCCRSTSITKASVVYVIDDDESMRVALNELLLSVGLHVETFASSQEFLAFPKHDGPSCLMLDVRLRGESGLAFQKELVKSSLRMPILFMTGQNICSPHSRCGSGAVRPSPTGGLPPGPRPPPAATRRPADANLCSTINGRCCPLPARTWLFFDWWQRGNTVSLFACLPRYAAPT